MLYQLIRPILFSLAPEEAHELSFKSLKLMSRFTSFKPIYKPVRIMGLTFPNRVGLAAGLDKNGCYSDLLFKLGFGFVEIGTLTPKAQAGNPKPRLFRLTEDQAIINRMGFNNNGIDEFVRQSGRLVRYGILGINIGKNKTTPIDQAIDDYLVGLEKVYPYADYVTINVSSPNTPNLRQLETGENLQALLAGITIKRKALQDRYTRHVPIVVKISPDLDVDALKSTVDTILQYGLDGMIVANTTLARDNLKSEFKDEQGGLSGRPLFEASLKMIELIHQHAKELPIIGVGGIMSAKDAKAKIDAGASLVQLYTGFIYKGPKLIQKTVAKLN